MSVSSPRNRSAPLRCRAIRICGWRCRGRRQIARLIADGTARQHSHRHRRADRAAGAALLPQAWNAVHHQLPHPLSRIHLRALAGPGVLGLGGAALVSQRRPGGDGGDAGAGQRIARARLSQRGAVAARRRHQAVSSARCRSRPAAADLSLCRPRRGGEESRSVSRSRSARHQGGRRRRTGARGAGAEISAKRCFSARGTARSWPRPMPPPTSSCFRAGPTRSAWCCWRRWPAACRCAAFPVTGPRDVIGEAPVGALERGFARGLPRGADDLAARTAARLPLSIAGRLRPAPSSIMSTMPAAPDSRDEPVQFAVESAAFDRLIRRIAPCPPAGAGVTVRDDNRDLACDCRRHRCRRARHRAVRGANPAVCRRRFSTNAMGARIFLKPEMLQRTGSFKFRGAYNKLSSIPMDARGGGVVAFSSGNHAQGVAACGAAARHAGDHRDAGRRAAVQARAHQGLWRRGRAVRPRPRGSRSHRPRDRRQARRHAGAAL